MNPSIAQSLSWWVFEDYTLSIKFPSLIVETTHLILANSGWSY
jgi:hypothetical protein